MKTPLVRLDEILKQYKSLVIAYSGGVDSTFLLARAVKIIGKKNVVAFTARTEFSLDHEIKKAQKYARSLGVRHIVERVSILKNEHVKNNTRRRCFFCKKEILHKAKKVAYRLKIKTVCEASNKDDTEVFRPGLQAARQLRVLQPLITAGLTKKAIRRISRRMHLPTFDQPSAPCLATRFPYETRLERSLLQRLARIETALKKMGFLHVRLRVHGDVARIEVPISDFKKILKEHVRKKVIAVLKKNGFCYNTLDIEGLRSGRMDEIYSR